MTTSDERLPAAGTAEAASEHDPEAAEAYAESVSIDPSHDEVNEYLKIAGAAPLTEQSDTAQADDVGA
ncbi:MAG: hypothetical protein M3228_14485 [Actinomycetota bacterium]|nr:hypothetical protein [Actinomycetota bacterium]